MRRRTAVTAVLMPVLIGLAACGSESTSAGSRGEPQSGGTLTIALPNYPEEGLNPHLGGAIGPTQVLRNSFDSLVAADYDESFHPWLAESWTISEDGLVYEFKLRNDVTFHDGEKFDAAAVKANFDLVIDGQYAPAVKNSTFRTLKSAEVVDDYTVRLTQSEPAADFLHTLSSLQGAIVSPKSLKSGIRDSGGVGLAGTGPFILTRVVPGQELDFEKYKDYKWPPGTAHHQGAAYLDKLVVKYAPEPSVRAGLLSSGEVDAIAAVAPNDVPLFKDAEGFQYEYKGSNVAPTSLYFNTTSGPTKDVRVRKALQNGADVDALVKAVLKDNAERAWGIVQPQSKFYDKKVESAYGNDVDLANKLLDEAGWTGKNGEGIRTSTAGEPLVVRLIATEPVPTLKTILEGYQAQLRQNIGVNVDLQFRDEGTVDKVRETNAYELFPRSVGGVYPGVVLDKVYSSTGAINGPKLTDPQVDGWLDAARYATDEKVVKENFDKVAQYALIDQVTTLPLYTDRSSVAAKSTVHDITYFIDPPRGLLNGWAYNTWIEQ
ncbi:ABC transporter substrate-binding protein [Phytohabitans kaempferiae]|uniref:ABC transporter substrate-binding protein n=1 Tax=Phytohabitans kaempferiae TaxID=1620943 RepID=A0ABV6MHM4_9ACTN